MARQMIFSPSQAAGGHLVPELLGAVVEDGEADAQPRKQRPQHSSRPATRHLVDQDQLVEGVELFGLDSAGDVRADVFGAPGGGPRPPPATRSAHTSCTAHAAPSCRPTRNNAA